MLIVIDWGTSNLRAYLLDDTGCLIAEATAAAGILSVKDQQFAHTLNTLIHDWLATHPTAPILLCGMIGSRQGWVEAPYVSCPIHPHQLANQLTRIPEAETTFKRAVYLIPGLQSMSIAGFTDVIRGEETQVIGAMQLIPQLKNGDEALICLPGTHAKWLHVKDQTLASFTTAMTGEVFALLKEHSILGRLFTEPLQDFYSESFLAGVQLSQQAGGLLHHLFSVRTQLLFDHISPHAGADYLSGILIGHECLAMKNSYTQANHVFLICSSALQLRYQAACTHFGLQVSSIEGDKAVIAGLFHLAKEGKII